MRSRLQETVEVEERSMREAWKRNLVARGDRCFELYCTVYCTVLYCIVLYCIVLYCMILH
jgi:hypothetical protein